MRLRTGVGAALLSLTPLAFGVHTKTVIDAPALSIPVGSLGFRPPGQLYILARYAWSSLNFLDKDQLLFTFRQARLMKRNAGEGSEPHTIHAVILDLPSGKVAASSEWRVVDRTRYIWPLEDGKFVVRHGDELESVDRTLTLHPMLRTATPVRYVSVSPDGELLVVESDLERHSAEEHQKLVERALALGDEPPAEDVQLRVVELKERAVIFHARAEAATEFSVSEGGYLARAEGAHDKWRLLLDPFKEDVAKEGKVLGQVSSTCAPDPSFLTPSVAMLISCPPRSTGHITTAFSTDGHKLWDGQWRPNLLWPTTVVSADGSTLAISWLAATHPVNEFYPVSESDVQAQMVYVLDAKTGAFRMSMPISPVLTAGGNYAISPDGKQLAVLNDGTIQIYNVPPPAPAETEAGAKK